MKKHWIIQAGKSFWINALIVSSLFFGAGKEVAAQRYLSDYDSTVFVKDTLRPLVRRLENLRISGYIQPQFQVAEKKGIASYSGGNFPQFSNNRFMLRRARVKFDYIVPSKNSGFPQALFTFQFEATERDVNVRDMFVRIYEPTKNNLSLTMGLVARPFGYEVNLSSSYRETPERGRASQILMPSERDLGAMITYESQKKDRRHPQLKFDAGFFNGQGKSGPSEFDSYKDLISRLVLKPFPVGSNLILSSGLSILRGGWIQPTKYKYEMEQKNGEWLFAVDSSLANEGDKAPRRYYGADVQLVKNYSWGGKTEVRGEYWRGKQPGTEMTTVNPGALPTGPTYIRNFDAAFLYFLQNIFNENWELMIKYDWYDPNLKVEGLAIGKIGNHLTPADIRYETLGVGLTHYFNENLKVLGHYDFVHNESTQLPGYERDIDDNVFTLRVQLRF